MTDNIFEDRISNIEKHKQENTYASAEKKKTHKIPLLRDNQLLLLLIFSNFSMHKHVLTKKIILYILFCNLLYSLNR